MKQGCTMYKYSVIALMFMIVLAKPLQGISLNFAGIKGEGSFNLKDLKLALQKKEPFRPFALSTISALADIELSDVKVSLVRKSPKPAKKEKTKQDLAEEKLEKTVEQEDKKNDLLAIDEKAISEEESELGMFEIGEKNLFDEELTLDDSAINDKDGLLASKKPVSILNLEISGKAIILDAEVTASVRFERDKKGEYGLVLEAKIPTSWKISDAIPALQGSTIDNLAFSNLSFIASNVEFNDPVFKKINPGLGIGGSLQLSGPLSPIRLLIPDLEETFVKVYGTIGRTKKDLRLRAHLSSSIDFISPQVQSGAAMLEVTGEPSLSLIASLDVQPTPDDEKLYFAARLKLMPTKAAGAATMEGSWKNPLGIVGVELKDVAIELELNYAQFAATGLPSSFGIAGYLALGKTELALATKITADFTKMILHGSLKRIYLSDFVGLANNFGAHINPDSIPPLNLEELSVYLAPRGGSIGELKFPFGLSALANVNLFGAIGKCALNVNKTGILVSLEQDVIRKFKQKIADVGGETYEVLKSGIGSASEKLDRLDQKIAKIDKQIALHQARKDELKQKMNEASKSEWVKLQAQSKALSLDIATHVAQRKTIETAKGAAILALSAASKSTEGFGYVSQNILPSLIAGFGPVGWITRLDIRSMLLELRANIQQLKMNVSIFGKERTVAVQLNLVEDIKNLPKFMLKIITSIYNSIRPTTATALLRREDMRLLCYS